jgi:serine protease AprX
LRRRLPKRRLTLTLLAGAAAGAIVLVTAAPVLAGRSTAADSTIKVIVQARTGASAQAGAAVRALGGRVLVSLPLVDGFSAELPAGAPARLSALPAVRAITPDAAVHFATRSQDSTGPTNGFPASTHAADLWAAGITGANVGVAVVDTGITPVDDLAGRVVAGPDLSGEHNSLLDSYGHGTAMAGLVGGDGTDSRDQPAGAYVGAAPGSTLVSVKVAGRSGATDVSTMLRGLQWVDSFRQQYRIRVVNLSWGTPSTAPTATDPLDFAVERLWRDGLAVVVAAGNTGPGLGTVHKPGDDPAVLTVGAYNDRQTSDATDDSGLAWSSRGPTGDGAAKPDLVAPGRSLVTTRAPGSYVDQNYPQARVGSAYILGSGTSEATAVTSGLVALLLAARPGLTPDQVKYALTSTASPISHVGRMAQGAGRVDAQDAVAADVSAAPQQVLTATGVGSLEASRGGVHVVVTCPGSNTPTEIMGEMDTFCRPWDSESWSSESWSSESWSSESWSSESWSSESWSSESWSSESWSTAFWGPRPAPGQHVPGELYTPARAGPGLSP